MTFFIFSAYCFQFIFAAPVRALLKFFCHLEVRGLDNLTNIRNAIFAPNHIHELDSIFAPASIPRSILWRPIFMVSRESDFYKDKGLRSLFYGGSFFKFMGAYPAYPGHHDYAYSLRNHIQLLRKGESVCIFPEGFVTKTGEMNEAKGGVAFLAHQTKRPVVPVGITGIHRMGARDFFMRKRHLVISFGKPISYEELFEDKKSIEVAEYKKIARDIMARVNYLMENDGHHV